MAYVVSHLLGCNTGLTFHTLRFHCTRLKTLSTLGPTLFRRPVDRRLFSQLPWECFLVGLFNKQHRNNVPNNLFAYFSDIQTMVSISKLHHKNLCSQITTKLKTYHHYTRITRVYYVSLIYHLHEETGLIRYL